jgi:copper chaperone CopZ
MKSHELTIEGMTCQHCVMHVKKELSKISGLVIEEVQIGKARVQYDDSKISLKRLEDAVHGAGYRLVSSN